MKKKICLNRAMSLLIAAALVCGLISPALAASDPGSGQEAGSSGSVVGAAYSDNANAYEIYPVPHSVTYPGGEFTLTSAINVVADGEVDTYTTDFLEEILTRFGFTMSVTDTVDNDKTNILLKIHGADDGLAPTVYTDLFTAADKYDPYLLTAEKESNSHGVITIVGKNADCVFYGVSTLQMMFTSFNGEKFLPVRIEDYSNTIFRGFIEGFYGGFDYDGRESQIRSIRDVKGNMYVFASKTDPYHGSNWSALYPTDELNQIKHLVDVGKEMKVNYTWSVHIGKGGALNGIDDRTNINETLYTQRLDQLKAKFQQLYDIGVRSFNVLNDDYNSGTHRVQVRFLNDINAWLKGKGDCMPLIYCCAGYNVAWAGNGAEAEALAGLDDDIYLYWTGANVNSPITQDSVDWLYEKSGQGVVTWINYPCSEHAKSGLFLGDISHYVSSADDLTDQYGILSNAINSPEANKVAYFQLLSWAWNRDDYTSYMTKLWENSFKYLQPEVYRSYLTIARNVSNCPGSSRISNGFPESEYIKDALAAVQTLMLGGSAMGDNANAAALLAEFNNILAAVADFRTNCANDDLKTEMEPWLKSLESVVTAGKHAVLALDALARNDVDAAWTNFSAASINLSRWDANQSSNPNYDADVMAKAGSKRLQPFANALVSAAEEKLLEKIVPGGSLSGEPTFYAVMGGVEQGESAQSDKIFDGNPATYGSFSVNQQADDYYGVDLGEVKLVTAVDILQGQTDTHHDYFHKAALECSKDGKNWITLVSRVNSHHIHVEDLSVAARYVRLRLTETGYGNKADYWTDIREFTVTTETADTQLYTNMAGLTGAAVSGDGGAYTLTVSGEKTLADGDYVGMCLPEITSIQAVTLEGTLPAGLTFQHSPNGAVWTDGVPTSAAPIRFIRLMNKSGAAVTGTLPAVTASQTITTALSFVSTNTSVYAGAWANVVDGDRSTLVHTGAKQEYGQYAVFDLGRIQPVHDVTVWVPESGNDIPHNLDISIGSSSDPDGSWTTIGELRNNGYEMNVPYRCFTCDGNGAVGRYIKLSIPDIEAANWIKINELEVNKTVRQAEPAGALSGSPAANVGYAMDGNLSTFYTGTDNEAGYIQYLLPEVTELTGVTILQGESSGAAVKAQKADGTWETLGTMTDAASTFDTMPAGGVVALRIEWTGKAPSIAEIIPLGAGNTVSGAAPTLRPNIYEQPADVAGVTVPNGTAIGNVSLPDRVDVTDSAGRTVSAPVTWTCGNYDGTVAGTYTFTGRFTESRTLFNPGCFTLTANVTVNPAASAGETAEQNLALNRPAYASGREVDSQGPAQAVDGSDGTLWSSNKMKQKDSSTKYDTIENAVSWITVDLGTDVSSITQVKMEYNAKVWPLEYYVQVGGAGISYDGYTTPSIDTEYSTTDTSNVTLSTSYADTMHALNAPEWTTIYSGTRAAGDTANPTITLGEGGDAAFTAEVPAGTRYLRLYFTKINPNALAGTGIGLKELTVTGTRVAPAVDTNIVSLAPASATGTVGTAFADLELPDTVIATLGDGSTVRVGVTWDGTGYNADSTDAQTFTGTITLPGGVTNTNNVKASLTLTLTSEPTIASVLFTPASLSVPNGTAFADLGLPTQGTATLTDGSTVEGTIIWTEGGYNAAQAGAQTISGTFTAGGKTASVTIQVTVAAPAVIRHTVTFQSEGSADTTVEVIHGQAIGTLSTPTREGYTFIGWFYGEPETRLTEEYVVNSDLTVTAKWTLNQYTVTFNTQDGADPTARTVNHGETVAKPADPTRTGYTFGGWYTEAGCTTEYDFTAPVTRAITLYAKWTKNSEPVPSTPTPSNPTPTGPSTTTETKKNEDGTTTTTVTDKKTGTVTETTEKADGSVEVVETRKDGTVTETVTDKDGGKVETVTDPEKNVAITVTDKDGEVLAEVKVPAEMPKLDEDKRFVDVPDDNWAAEAINNMAALGVIQGKGGQTFDRKSPMKRSELAEVLYKMSNGKAGIANNFTDVSEGNWYADSVAWAAAVGVVNGVGENSFAPDRTITREELATVLVRYAKLLGLDTSADRSELDAFGDKESTHDWAADAVAWCVKAGIIQGKGGSQLDPRSSASRAEVAAMLQRFVDMVGSK